MKAKLSVFFALLSVGFYILCIVAVKSGVQDMTSQGNYDGSYSIDWAYDYTGGRQFLYATGIFLAIYYGVRILFKLKGKRCETCSAVILAAYIVCVAVIVITQSHVLSLIVAAAVVMVSCALVPLINDLRISEDTK